MRKVVNLSETPSFQTIVTQFLTSFGIIILFAIGFSLIGLYAASLIMGQPMSSFSATQPLSLSLTTVNGLKIIQVFSQIGMFLLPALILARILFGANALKFTGFSGKAPFILFLLALVSYAALVPILDLVIGINQKMNLPDSLQWLEDSMRKTEEFNGNLIQRFIYMPNIKYLLVNIFLIAVVPAVCEEFFFRGFLQRTIYTWWRNKHVAVILTAIIFSAIHMQFFGFFPRMLLGMLLGYLFVWSGDLKLSIFVHFLNNFSSLVAAYFMQDKDGKFDTDAPMADYPFYLYLVSAAIGGFLLYQLYKYSRRKRTEDIGDEYMPLETGDIQWAKVFSSQSIYEAEIVAGNLESEGISAVIFNKKDSSYGFGEAEVHVHAEDVPRAQQLISSFKI